MTERIMVCLGIVIITVGLVVGLGVLIAAHPTIGAATIISIVALCLFWLVYSMLFGDDGRGWGD